MDKSEYLDEGFLPSKTKAPVLRGILVENDVKFPSNAKKAELVDLYNEHIAPIAPKLLKEHQARIKKASGEGIINEIKDSNDEKPKKKKSKKVKGEQESAAESETKDEDRKEDDKPKKTRKVSVTRKTSGTRKVSSKKTEKKTDDDESKEKFEPQEATIPKKRTKSPLSPAVIKFSKLSPKANTPRGKLFDDDDDDDEDDSKSDLFSESIIILTPKKKLVSKIKKEPKDSDKQKAAKKFKKSIALKLNAVQKVKSEEEISENKDALPHVVSEPESEPVKVEALPEPETIFEAEPSSEPAPVSVAVSEVPVLLPTSQVSVPIPIQESQVQTNSPIGNVSAIPSDHSFSKSSENVTPLNRIVTPFKRSNKAESTSSESQTPRSKSSPVSKKSTPRSSKKQTKIVEPVTESKEEESNDVNDDKNTVDLVKDDEMSTNTNISKTSSKSAYNYPSKFSILKVILFVGFWLSGIMIGYFGWWYREQTFLVGYCGQEILQDTIPYDEHTPVWLSSFGEYLDSFKPKCVPCPPHGRCLPYLELSCYNDFIDIKPWWFSLVPYPIDSKRCAPDTKKAEKLEIMIDVAIDLLRSRNAAINCGTTDFEDTSAGLSVSELHDMLLQMKAPYITNEEFEELWKRSLVELEKEPEIIIRRKDDNIPASVHTNNTVGEEEKENQILRSTSLSNVSLKCQILNTVVGSLTQYKTKIIIVALILIIIQYIRLKIDQYRLYKKKIGILYTEVLNKLKKQRKLSTKDTSQSNFIGSIQLRDLILHNEQNLNYKMKIWESVSHKVENNTNIRFLLQENHGEIMKVWEWITDLD